MLAVVKTPLIRIQIKGRIPTKLISFLKDEYGTHVRLVPDKDDELVDAFETDWYRKIKRTLTPGVNMRIYRQNHRLTQAQLGERLGGIPKQHISNMENDRRPISKKTALKLAKAFHVSVEKFIA